MTSDKYGNASQRPMTPAPDSGQARPFVARGLDMVSQFRDTFSEAMRTRRDPVLVARRRRDAARRRITMWSLVSLVLLAIVTGLVLTVVYGQGGFSDYGGLILSAGLSVFSGVNLTRSVIDFRHRNRVLSELPPPQPTRPAIAGSLRPLIQQLDGYSDALRASVGAIGVYDRTGPQSSLRELRDETLQAADAAEVRIRGQAAEYFAMTRTGQPAADSAIAATCAHLKDEVTTGVAEYGQLVAAASAVAAHMRQLTETAAPTGSVTEITQRLTALTHGMRELNR